MWSEEDVRRLERRDRVATVRHNRRKRRQEAKELQEKKKRSSSSLLWVWEFAKKLVLICSVLYVFSFAYACVAMWRFFDFTYLGTLIEQTSDIMRTCVFGYLIKAGVENVFKISSGTNNPGPLSDHEREAACVPPDGDD